MNWGSLEAFLAMGGYAWYVWGSYAVTVLLIAVELVLVRARHRAARRACAMSGSSGEQRVGLR